MLTLNNLEVVYDSVILVLKGISLTAREGEITTLLGANGAGKTTTLKTISGLLHAERGEVTKGTIDFNGERIDRLPPHDIVRRGIVQVFEGRRVFENLTVEENLVVGGHTRVAMQTVRHNIDMTFELFPILKERRRQQAGYLSGGEQQMLAIGRALMSEPKVMLLDEPSLGLAPQITEDIFRIIVRLKNERQMTGTAGRTECCAGSGGGGSGLRHRERPHHAAGLRRCVATEPGGEGILSRAERGRSATFIS